MIMLILMIAVFWILMGPLFDFEKPEIEYLNETEVTLIMNMTFSVNVNTYQSVSIPAEKGDLLNYTLTVLEGGTIDYFILEEDQRDMLIEALEGKGNRFESYERGRGRDTNYGSSEFLLISDQEWYLFINNYGHIQNGARPESDVLIHILIEKIGQKSTSSFSIN